MAREKTRREKQREQPVNRSNKFKSRFSFYMWYTTILYKDFLHILRHFLCRGADAKLQQRRRLVDQGLQRAESWTLTGRASTERPNGAKTEQRLGERSRLRWKASCEAWSFTGSFWMTKQKSPMEHSCLEYLAWSYASLQLYSERMPNDPSCLPPNPKSINVSQTWSIC